MLLFLEFAKIFSSAVMMMRCAPHPALSLFFGIQTFGQEKRHLQNHVILYFDLSFASMFFKYNFIYSSSVFHMYVLNVNKTFIQHWITTFEVLFGVKTHFF